MTPDCWVVTNLFLIASPYPILSLYSLSDKVLDLRERD